MNRTEKEAVIGEVTEKLRDARTTVLTDYRGLTVKDIAELRSDLRAEGIEYKVYKNTLVKRAANDLNISGVDEYLDGPTAMAFGYDDPVMPAKLLAAYAKRNKLLSIKGGLLDGSVINAAAVNSLATLPSREVLLAKLAGTLQAPITALANVLIAPIRGLARALNQVAEQKQQ